MNEIQLLSRLREDVPEASPADLATARDRLMAHLHPAQPDRHPRRAHRPVWLVAVGAAAAAAVVVASTAGVEPFRNSNSAADTLRHAAGALTVPLGAQPDQYVKVTRHQAALGLVEVPGSTWQGYVARTVTETYVPADPDRAWVVREYGLPADTFYGGSAARAAAKSDAPTATKDRPRVERAVQGRFGNGELGGQRDTLVVDDLPGLPRDPQRLLDLLRSKPVAVDMDWQESVMRQIATFLDSGLAPADLQQTMYQALALLPDIEVLDDQTSLDGRSGTAFGLDARSGPVRDQVLIDPSTGEYLGQRQVQTAAVGSVPAGTVTSSTSVDIAVVDDAP